MNANIPFQTSFDLNGDWDFFSKEKETPNGVWPLQRNGVWHTGIHLTNSINSIVKAIVPGEIIAYRICDNYIDDFFDTNIKVSTSFVLMRHYFGEKGIPFYILYNGFASKTAIDTNEFSLPENVNGTNKYRPLFFKKWVIKNDVINELSCPVISFYNDKEHTDEAGYLFRDGRYLVCESKNGSSLYRHDKQFYLKSNIPGFNKVSDTNNTKYSEYILACKEHVSNSDYTKIINVYYDKEHAEKKFSFSLKKVFENSNNHCHIHVNSNNLNEKVQINFTSRSQYDYTFDTTFHILSSKKYTVGTNVLFNTNNELSNIIGCSVSAIEYNEAGSPITELIKKIYIGDIIKINSLVAENNSNYEYSITRISSSNHIKAGVAAVDKYINTASAQDGYIDCTDVKTLLSEKLVYDLSNKNVVNTSNTKQLVKLYDNYNKLSEGGITLLKKTQVKDSEVIEVVKTGNKTYVLLKINYVNEAYQNDSYTKLCTSGNKEYFFGYLEVDNSLEISQIVTSSYRDDTVNETVIWDSDKTGDEYFGPIGIFDADNNLDLHLETFFTDISDFSFKKRRKNDEDVQMVQISNEAKSTLFEVGDKYKLAIKETNFWKNKKENEEIKFYCKKITGYDKLSYKIFKKISLKLDKELYNYSLDGNYVIFADKYKIENTKIKKNKKYIYEKINEQDYILIESKNKTSKYYIFSDKLNLASKKEPLVLDENTYVFSCKKIKLVQIDKNKEINRNNNYLLFRNSDFYTCDGVDYLCFTLQGKQYFIEESDISHFKINSEYEHELEETNQNGGTKIEQDITTKRYNISDFPSFVLLEEPPRDSDSDYKCDILSLVKKVKLSNKDNIKLSDIYENKNLYDELSRLVIKCPSMWEKPNDWDSNYSNYITDDFNIWALNKSEDLNCLKEYIERQFIFSKNNKRDIFGANVKNTKYYYFNPIKFLKYYLKETVQEMNPYADSVITDLPGSSSGGICLVNHNPGFTPIYTSGDKYSLFSPLSGSIIDYSQSTGLFNEDYIGVPSYYRTKHYFYHEGLDLRGPEGTDVYSLIFGQVLAYGILDNYGRSIIIKRTSRESGIYLIAHLSEYGSMIDKGAMIAPGDIVGKCGGSGTGGYNVYIPHLHISFHNMKDKLSPSDSIKTIKDKLTTRRNPLNIGDIKNENKDY